MSRRPVAHPPPQPATYLRPPAAPRPRPATPELRPEPRAAGERGGGGGGSGSGFLGGVVIRSQEPLTGEDEAFLRGIYLRQDRAAAIKKSERARGANPGGLERAAPPTSSPPAVSGSSGPCLLTLPLPRFLLPLSPPAGPWQYLAGLFGEGLRALWVCPWRQAPFSIQSRNGVCSRNPSEGSTEAKLKKESCPPGAAGDATRAAGRPRRPPGFALRGGPELVLILSPAIESPLSTPLHPGYVFSQTWIFF